MSKHKQGYINRRKPLAIKVIELAPLISILFTISVVLGFCAIASN